MLVFNPEQAREDYQDKCRDTYSWSNYESYKQRRSQLSKCGDKAFRRDWCLDWDFIDYYDYIDYEHEIDRLKFYWYKEYVNDFMYRREDSIYDYVEDDDER